jgi:hypothetical protein
MSRGVSNREMDIVFILRDAAETPLLRTRVRESVKCKNATQPSR